MLFLTNQFLLVLQNPRQLSLPQTHVTLFKVFWSTHIPCFWELGSCKRSFIAFILSECIPSWFIEEPCLGRRSHGKDCLHQAGWHLRQLLYTAGRMPQLEAEYIHGPSAQDAVAKVQLLQLRVGAQHRAEVSPPLYAEGLTLSPVSVRGRSERKYD